MASYQNQIDNQTAQPLTGKQKRKAKRINKSEDGASCTSQTTQRTVMIERVLNSHKSVCHKIYDTENRTQPIREGKRG